MRQIRWTANCIACGQLIQAQAKSSRTELTRRLLADDPCWHRQMVFTREKAWDNKHFRRGIAFRAQPPIKSVRVQPD